ARPRGYHRRDKLLALFWPETDQELGRGAMRQALHFLRSSLGPDVLGRRGDEEVGIAAAALWCDAIAFEELLEQGKPAEALELYRGPLLDGVFVEDASVELERWIEEERVRLSRRAATAAWELADSDARAGRHAAAAHW